MLKNITLRELVIRLRTFGFSGPYSGGRHLFMTKGSLKLKAGISRGRWNKLK